MGSRAVSCASVSRLGRTRRSRPDPLSTGRSRDLLNLLSGPRKFILISERKPGAGARTVGNGVQGGELRERQPIGPNTQVTARPIVHRPVTRSPQPICAIRCGSCVLAISRIYL